MRLLNFTNRNAPPDELQTERLILRRPTMDNYLAWAELRRRSAEFLRPYEPQWTTDELSRASYRARMRRHEADITAGRGLPWFLFDHADPKQLLGGITLSNLRRGVSDTATLGYWMGEPYAGKGYMSEAVNAVCLAAFDYHKLHRIEAATVLDNQRSQRLLLSCGFQKEGTARAYLKINGAWRDHMLFARLADDPAPIISP